MILLKFVTASAGVANMGERRNSLLRCRHSHRGRRSNAADCKPTKILIVASYRDIALMIDVYDIG